MRVTEWLDGFLVRHIQRHPRSDWPDPKSQAWTRFHRVWLDTMLALQPRPKEAEADAASLAIHGDAIRWPQDHAHVVSDALQRSRTIQTTLKSPDASRATLEALSKDCPFCSGSGLACVHSTDGSLIVLATHCVCPHGRWIRRRTTADLQRRIFDLEAILEGRLTGWTFDDPDLVGFTASDIGPLDWREKAAVLAQRNRVDVVS